MGSCNDEETFFDALDEEQFLRDVEETELFYDANSNEETLLGQALDDFEHNQSGAGQFQFNLDEFRPRVNRRFGTVQRNYRMRIQHNENYQRGNVIEEFERGFSRVLRPLLENLPPRDRVEVSLRSNRINRPYHSLPLEVGEWGTPLSAGQRILTEVMRTLQSNENFDIDDSFNLEILHVQMPPAGSSRPRKKANRQSYEKNRIDKRSIVTIRNDDELCAARALAVGIAHCEMKANPNCRELKLDYDLVKRSNRPFQKMRALDLIERAGLTPGPVGLEDLDCLQNILPDYQIKVVSARHLNTIIYRGKSNSRKVIHLYLDQERAHFDVIVNMKAFVGGVYYCIDCEKSFNNNDFEHHSCPGKRCGCCKQLEREDFLNKNVNEHYEMLTCETCKRKFFGEQCLINHRSKSNTGCEVDIMSANCICRTFRKCTDCHINLKGKQKHECGKQECHVCGNMENLSTHKCFLQKADPQRKSRKKRVCIDDEDEDSESIRGSQEDVISEHEIKPLFVYADTEAMLDDDLHQPILLMASTNEDDEIVDFSGVDCVEQFLSWIQDLKDGDSKRDVIVLFHNLQSYDGYMILHELYNLCISPRLIVSGAKLLSITWDNVKFKDSLAFLPFPLATFPKTFGLRELKKGFYPYFFDTPENQSYVGPLPAMEMFDPDGMSSKRREEFEA